MRQVLGRLEKRKQNDRYERRLGLFQEAQHGLPYASSLRVTGERETGMCVSGTCPAMAHSSAAVTAKRDKEPEQGEEGGVWSHKAVLYSSDTEAS